MKKKQFKLVSGLIEIWKSKLLLTMRLTVIALCFTVFQGFALMTNGQNAKVNLKMENVSIKQVLSSIEEQTNLFFMYNGKLVDVERKVNVNVESKDINDVLKEIFSGTNVKYEIDNRQILLSSMEGTSGFNSQQQKSLTGKVIDSSGVGLPGVSVVVKGTTTGTITDIDGNYSLNNVPANATLLFSFVGMRSQEIQVGSKSSINVTLEDETIGIEEVVAVGYGTQKKSVITGSIASVKAEDLQSSSVTNADQALQGKTSGVQVISTSGAPGATTQVRIRGYSSNGSANPLFIVDGVKTSDINNIDPNDISNMEVLKDAASAAIYGAEGGNGVIIITTKTAKAGTKTINYDFQYMLQNVANLPDMLNSQEYAQYYNEAGLFTIDTKSIVNDTDWLKAVFEPAGMMKHHISFSSGTEKSNFMLSLSTLDQNGIVVGDKDKFKRYTVRMNSDSQIKDWLKVGHNFSFAYTKKNAIGEDNENGGTLSSALLMDPLTPVYYEPGKEPVEVQTLINSGKKLVKDENGNYYGISKYISKNPANPFVRLANNKSATTSYFLQGNVFAEIKPVEHVTYTSKLGYDLLVQNSHLWNPTYYYNTYQNYNDVTSVTDNNLRRYRLLWENFVSYSNKIGDHSINILAGMSAETQSNKFTNATGGPMINELPNFAQLDFISSQANSIVSGTELIDKKLSYFGRATYDYKNRYLLQGSIRRDGASTSLLPTANRWGIFPSFSLGWVFTEESFFPKSLFNYGKLRASWGENGSLSNLTNYMYRSSITSTNLLYQLGDNKVYTVAVPNMLDNPDLRWETSVQTDIGIDLKMFDSRLNLTVDYFNKKTTDLITPNTPPIESGNTASAVNGGDVVNRGFEFELGYRGQVGKFKYVINGNLATLHNEVTFLNPTIQRILGGASNGAGLNYTAFQQGFPVWYFWGYKTNGINQTTGQPNFVDQNSDGIINDTDKKFLGSAIPKLNYGGSINLSYQGFDLSMNVQGQYGNQNMILWMRNDLPGSNIPKFLYDGRWAAGSTTATRPKAGFDPKTLTSDQMMFDGSYMRIKQLQLGYTLPNNLIRNLKMKSARVYISLDDYFTFTKFPGMDPEAGSTTNSSLGLDRGMYPVTKKALFGVSITL